MSQAGKGGAQAVFLAPTQRNAYYSHQFWHPWHGTQQSLHLHSSYEVQRSSLRIFSNPNESTSLWTHQIDNEEKATRASWEDLFSNCKTFFWKPCIIFSISVCSIVLIPWWGISHSHPVISSFFWTHILFSFAFQMKSCPWRNPSS